MRADSAQDRIRIIVGVEKYRDRATGILYQRKINVRIWVFTNGDVFGVMGHADYLCPIFVTEEFEALAHGLFVWPEALGRSLVNNRYPGAVLAHRCVEPLASHQRDSHGLEVVRSHVVDRDQHAVARSASFLAFRKNTAAKASAEQGNVGRKSGRFYAWCVLHDLQGASFELAGARNVIVKGADVKGQHGEIMSVEARISLLSIPQAHDKKTGAHQCNQR